MKNILNNLAVGSGETQDALDMYNLSVLFRSYELQSKQSDTRALKKLTAKDIEQIELELKGGNYYDDMDYCHTCATKQVR